MRADFRFFQFLNLHPSRGVVETNGRATGEVEQRREMSNSRPYIVTTGPVLGHDNARIVLCKYSLEQCSGTLQNFIVLLRSAGTSAEVKSKADRPAIEKRRIQRQSWEVLIEVAD